MKGIGGFYYVQTEAGLIEAKGRGIFRKDGTTLAVGDFVDLDILDADADQGVINEILPRKNQFIRPPIVNVDIFLIVCAATRPKPNFALIDKFLVMAEMHNVEAVLCVNKCDAAPEAELAALKAVYLRSRLSGSMRERQDRRRHGTAGGNHRGQNRRVGGTFRRRKIDDAQRDDSACQYADRCHQ